MRPAVVLCTAWLATAVLVGGWVVVRHQFIGDRYEPDDPVMPHPFAAHRALRPVSNGFSPDVVLPTPIAPIRDLTVVGRAEADRHIQPTELVLGITLGDSARAYPLNMMTGPRREVLNDTLAGTPMAATW